MHIETHKSIGIICEDYHTTFTHLVILGLACFVFGFFLGKIEAEIVWFIFIFKINIKWKPLPLNLFL